jgi:N-acetylglucosaminyl-diphospho-decaprenol L-rhamnosyltransferase
MTSIHLLVLNYNGRDLLAECLPSVLRAASRSRHACQVAVVDNSSTDGSAAFLQAAFPDVRVFVRPNRGLCSYNEVLGELDSPVVVLLNNDIKLAADCVDRLVEPLVADDRGVSETAEASGRLCFLTAPLCWLFDGRTYEGLQTAVRWRYGLVQALSDYPGHERLMFAARRTASAGAVMAVDRQAFLSLGGFDPLYLPGRLEDLDLVFRGYMAGYEARYVPEAVAYHKGEATFRRVYGAEGSRRLALRNTLLFQWKNLRHPRHIARHLCGLAGRLVGDVVRAAWTAPEKRFAFTQALLAAMARLPDCLRARRRTPHACRLERAYFREFDASQAGKIVGRARPATCARADWQDGGQHAPYVSQLHVSVGGAR